MDLQNAFTLEQMLDSKIEYREFLISCFSEAKEFLDGFSWHGGANNVYVGMCFDGILSVFLFDLDLKIEKEFEDDNLVWVVVGDLPPAYITSEDAPNPACALDGYVGAMTEWVDAALRGEPVNELIPVNVESNEENALLLKRRLEFIEAEILSKPEYQKDLEE